MNENRGEVEINLLDVLGVFVKRWWMILLATVLCGAMMFAYAYTTYTPMYKSTAKMYVNNDSRGDNKVSISSNDILAAQALVNTYCEILQSRLTLEPVIQEAKLNYSYEKLLSMISCGSVNETEIFYISVVSHNADESKMIVDTIVDVLPSKISEVIDGSSVRTVENAVKGKELSNGFSTKAVIGAFIGFVLSAGLFFVYDVLVNDTLSTEDWMVDAYKGEIPLLAVIPDVNHSNGKKYGRYKYYRRSYYESKTADSK